MTDEPDTPRRGAGRAILRIAVYFVIIAVPLSLYLTYRHFDRNLKTELERALTDLFGRPVVVEGSKLSLPINVDGIVIAGDGEIDTGPVMILSGIKIWPTLEAFFGSDRIISSVIVDSSHINVIYSQEENRWSTSGLFPRPPPDVPASKTIRFDNLKAAIRSGPHLIEETMRAALTLERKGDYSFSFHTPFSHGTILRTGAVEDQIAHQVILEFDTITHVNFIQNLLQKTRLIARYEKRSSALNVSMEAIINERPFSIDGRFHFDSPTVVVSGDWRFDTGSGTLTGSLDRLTKLTKVSMSGNVDFDARLFHKSLTGGILTWKYAELEGELGSRLATSAVIESKNLSGSGQISFEGLSGEVKVSGVLTPGGQASLALLEEIEGTLAFRSYTSPNMSTGAGRFDLNGNMDRLTIAGKVDAFAGSLETNRATLRISDDGRPVLIKGAFTLANIDIQKMGMAFNWVPPEDLYRFSDLWTANGKIILSSLASASTEGNSDSISFLGTIGTTDLVFSKDDTVANRKAKRHVARIDLSVEMPVTADLEPAGDPYITKATLKLDGERTVIQANRVPVTTPLPVVPLKVVRLDAGHIKEHISLMREDLANADSIQLKGSLSGSAQITPEKDGESSYFIELDGGLTLRAKPLRLQVIGSIAPLKPFLIFHVHAVDPQALYQTTADIMPSVSGDIVKMSGQCTATLTAAGESWEDINVEGMFGIKEGRVDFIADPVSISGINGEIPFRLRRGKEWSLVEMSPKDSRNIHVRRTAYGEIALLDLFAKTRFNLRTLHIDNGTFDFAGGTGAGAFAIDFPDTGQPRIAFFGRASNFDVAVFYTMMPFKGALGGRGRGEIELMTGEGWDLELVKLIATLHIDSGIIGSELLKVFVKDMRAEGTAGEITKNALLEMSEWNFKEADLRVRLDQSYYSPDMAIRKFGHLVRSEIIGDYTIIGDIRPLAHLKVWEQPLFGGFKVQEKIVVEAAPMRLLMHRVGRLGG